ncbi:SGNH/GDSL hydrolase family protein [Candidatus Uabimicrobium amorphum]|uniref:Uncharacterized protein n=1 Tax=Uabimicrobium amorphum TaxID=2596890 RepID=A0A5S9II88_UABAM|nr:SGNH/GDSL hydrolase family protein [Candidatus Uabimicrobium amorphum]BBM81956.1 hypothetical protein UABAM_00299 [Candidatus Uabimicrobium amorphum]
MYSASKISRVLLFWAIFFLTNALFYNYFFLDFLNTRYFHFSHFSASKYKIFCVEFIYLLIGFTLFYISFSIKTTAMNHFWQYAFIFASSILSLFVICELALVPFVDLRSIYTKDDIRGWKLQANAKGRILGMPFSINAKGVRGKEIDYKRSQSYRILYLGDSVTFGFMIEKDRDTLPYQIENCLKKHRVNVETINAGVCGYAPSQEYDYLVKEGIKYNPHLVVISVVLNDVTDNIFFENLGDNIAGFESLAQDNIFTYSRFLLLLKMLYVSKTKRQNYFAVNRELCDSPQNDKFAQYLAQTKTELLQIQRFCRSHNIKTLFVFFPCQYQLSKKPSHITPQVILQQDLSFLDLYNPFYQAQNEKPIYYRDFWHPTIKGYHLAAQEISSHLLPTIPKVYFTSRH